MGAELRDQVGLDLGRFVVVGYAPADQQVGMLSQLPDASAARVGRRFADAGAAELIEPFPQAAPAAAAEVGFPDVDDAGAGHPQPPVIQRWAQLGLCL